MTAAISSSPNIPKPAASRASLALPTAASKGASSFLDIEYLLMSLQFEEIGREHGVDLKVPHLYRLDHLSVLPAASWAPFTSMVPLRLSLSTASRSAPMSDSSTVCPRELLTRELSGFKFILKVLRKPKGLNVTSLESGS